MATPLFFVDLSEDARDYQHTALEPGLPLLDRQHVNYQILRKWLGDYIAEPEWRNEDVVTFYLNEDERGRLEGVDCHPVSKGELEKKFAQDVENLRIKIKKIKPESSTEQMVHRILKKSIAEQTNDLDASDFDSYFFKCSVPHEEPCLVWCCGYQRADLEPLKAKLWRTPEGDFLGVRPPLQGGRVKKKKRKGLGVLASPWLMMAIILLLGLFLWTTRPKLVVTPTEWAGPLGSRIEFKVEDHRWYFFKKDVTSAAFVEARDPRVLEFESYGAVANAVNEGQTVARFSRGELALEVTVKVGPATPPDTLTIEPADDVRVAIGGTKKLKAIGHYDDGNTVDLTRQVEWWEESGGDNKFLVLSESEKGQIQGDSVGATKVFARYAMLREDDTYAESSMGVQVVLAEFTSLTVKLEPDTFSVGQSSRVEVVGIAKDGAEHTLSGSSLLKCKVSPTTAASVEGPYLTGREEGVGEVQVSYDDLDASVAFNVSGRMLGDDVFVVTPNPIDDAVVYELIGLNVRTGTDEPITAVSSNVEVVEVFRTEDENAGFEVWLAARSIGQAEVTVSQAAKSAVVPVTVTDGVIESLEFNPPVYTMKVGQPESANLIGATNARQGIKIVPDELIWERQPRVENVDVNKRTMLLNPLAATELPQDMEVRLGTMLADATVEVRAGEITALDMLGNGFGVHPPVPTTGKYMTDGILYDADRGGLLIDESDPFALMGEVPKGALLVEHNGIRLDSLSEADLLNYWKTHRVGDGDVIRYQGLDGVLATRLLGDATGAVLDFKILDVESTNLTAESFNANLRLYLRRAGEYRLTDSAGGSMSEWKLYPDDATPLVVTPALARTADDTYELWMERRTADQSEKFQMKFGLGRVARRVESVDVDPVIIDRTPDVVIDRTPDVVAPVIMDDDDDGRRVIRKRTTIRRRSGDGAAIIRSEGNTVVVSGSDSDSTLVSSPRRSVAGSPGSGSRSPSSSSPSPNSPSPSSPSPNSPSPESSSPSPSPSSPSPSPASPAKPSPSPAKPSPSPAKPSPSPAKPSPSPAKPSPSPASPSPAKPKPSPAPPGSDTRAPAKPSPASPALAQPTPAGSDTRAPSGFRPRTPGAQPASAYATPAGSSTRGTPTRPGILGSRAGGAAAAGSASRSPSVPPTYTGGDSPTDKDGKSKLLKAMQQHNLDRKKRENITGQGRVPVIRSSKSKDGGTARKPVITSSKKDE